MKKVICFDLFSTLVDVGSVPISVGRFTADILGMDKERWNELCFSEHHEICQSTVAADVIRTLVNKDNHLFSEDMIQQAAFERQNRFNYALESHIQEDVLEGIKALKRDDYVLILVSNASSDEVVAWPQSPLCQYFDHSVFSCSVGLKKPDRAIYEHACALAGISTNEGVFVGDGGSNELIGAKRAGMSVLMMTRFLNEKKFDRRQLFGPYIDGEVKSTSEVLEWFNARCSVFG